MKTKKYYVVCFTLFLLGFIKGSYVQATFVDNTEEACNKKLEYPYSNTKEQVEVNKNHGFNVKKFSEIVGEMWEYTTAGENKEPILFMGATGEGKSTSINFLLGLKMVEKEYKISGANVNPFSINTRKVIDVAENEPGALENSINSKKYAKIGHQKKAETLFPAIYKESTHNLFLCDFAGFFDTRGLERRAGIAISSRAMIDKTEGIKGIVFVISRATLNASRAKVFSEVLSALKKMFASPLKYIDSIFFCFTKANGWKISDFGTTVFEVYQEIKVSLQNNGEEDDKSKDNKTIYDLLSMMMTKDYINHFLLIDPLEYESRDQILNVLQTSKIIPPNKFRFVGDEDIFQKLLLLYKEKALAGIDIIANLNSFVQKNEREKTKLKKLRDEINSKQNEPNVNLDDITKCNPKIKILNTNIENIEKDKISKIKRKDELLKKIRTKRKEIDEMDTSKVVVWDSFEYTIKNMREIRRTIFRDYHEIDIEISIEVPYLHVDIKHIDGELKNVKELKELGRFSAYYWCVAKKEPKITITMYTRSNLKFEGRIKNEKRNLEDWKEELSEIKNDLKYLRDEKKYCTNLKFQHLINMPDTDILKELKKLRDNLIAYQKKEVEKIEKSLESILKVYKDAQKKFKIEKEFFDIIVNTYLYLGIQKCGSIYDFVEYYKKYCAKCKYAPIEIVSKVIYSDERKDNN